MSSLPNLFLIGAPKSGTTSLAYKLSYHHDVFLPKKKEPRYFDAHTYYDYEEDYPLKSLDEYLGFFDSSEAKKCKYRLDASVFNMYSKKSIDQILNISPDAKFIVILRDPVAASISMHSQRLKYSDRKFRELSENFLECWRMIEDRKIGLAFPKKCRNKFLFRYDLLYSYEKYLPYIIKKIKSKNLFIGFYDDYKLNEKNFFKSIFKFLDIQHLELKNFTYNKSYILKESYLLIAFERISNFTFPIRVKIGLTGGIIKKFKNFLFNFYKQKTYTKYDLKEVRVSFAKTYSFLKILKNTKGNLNNY